MNVFETDYSNLFAAGLRVIQSRSTGRRSSSEPHLSGTPDHDQHPTASNRASSSCRTYHFPTRLWRLPSPRRGSTESADPSLTAAKNDAKSKPARRRSMPGGVMEETTLDVRIWDWSTRVSHASTILEEEDECVDPYMGKVDPVDVPVTARTPILVALSSAASLWEHELPPLQPLTPSRSSQRARRVSLQTLPVHTMLPKRPHRSPFELGDETVWESASSGSESDTESESGLDDDDWHQFRVEWIDFDVAR